MSLARYLLLLLPLLFLSQLPLYSAQNSTKHDNCSTFNCGKLGEIGFPFFRNDDDPSCGVVSMNCTTYDQPKAQFRQQGKWYPVIYINYLLNMFQIHDEDLQSHLVSNRCDLLQNFSEQAYLENFSEQKPPSFISFNFSEIRPIFKCKHNPGFPSAFFDQFLHYNCTGYDLYYKNQDGHLPSLPANLSASCSVIHLPPAGDPGYTPVGVKDNLTLHWGAHFTVDWKVLQECVDCVAKGRKCQSTANKNFKCSKKVAGGNIGRKVLIGVFSGIGSMLFAVTFLLLYYKKWKPGILMFNGDKTTGNIEQFIKQHGSFAPKRYRFKEIKKMTQSFKDKLGHGGFGSVFKGVLNDGRLVAVKVLSEIKGNGEEFINEVASISRTSHVNIVSLLGYCFDGSKRALIYEFMTNGSLEKYIYDKDSSVEYSNLGWVRLHDISIGIARGLEYLHRGCNTRILHFDIKPHNILLDQDFCPKISDFGLAKLCPRKDSIISMIGARGTAGYIAPEVFCRNFGGISHKSDVYSYGMMILEMVGGRKNIVIAVDHTSEIYFPHWIYKRIEMNEDLGLHGILSEAQEDIPRKMILVGLWCIQTNPLDRPTISRVLEMLEGSLEVIEIPPKPYLSSPSRVEGGSSMN